MRPSSLSPPRLASVAGLVLLSACASDASLGPNPVAQCRTEPVQWAIGQAATQEVMGRVWRESGAGLIRPIAPNQAVRRDQRPDRVNVSIDASNVITGIDCG